MKAIYNQTGYFGDETRQSVVVTVEQSDNPAADQVDLYLQFPTLGTSASVSLDVSELKALRLLLLDAMGEIAMKEAA